MSNLSEILPDLLGIEVNTIIKTKMTAEKMPSLPFALHDIIRLYGRKLEHYGVDLEKFFSEDLLARAQNIDQNSRKKGAATKGKPDLAVVFSPDLLQVKNHIRRFDFERVTNGWISFDIIRFISRYLARANQTAWKNYEIDYIILERIRRNCDQLTYILRSMELNPKPGGDEFSLPFDNKDKKAIGWDGVLDKTIVELLRDDLRFRRLPLKSLSTEKLLIIRKIWEIGTEEVVAQTSIQVDGDVTTRLGLELHEGKYAAHREGIMQAHLKSVDVSLKQWHGLVQVAVKLVSDVFGGIMGFGKKQKI
jgi:hypothetical protein